MDKKTVFIKLPDGCKISPDKSHNMIFLIKWFQKCVDKDIKRISVRKENMNEVQ